MWGFITFCTIKLRKTQKNAIGVSEVTPIDSQSFCPYEEM